MGCHRGTGARGGLSECSARVDPIGSDTRIQQREPARGPRPFALQRTLPKRSKHAPGHRRVCDCGTAGDGVIREVDGPLTNINGTKPRMSAKEVIADRAQAQFAASSAASKVAQRAARCIVPYLVSRKVRGVTECDPRTLIRPDFSP